MSRYGNRQDLEPAYILHHYPYRDTSMLLELFSRDEGRVGAVAKGVRGRRGRWQGVLQPFTPLLVSWSGKGDLATLTHAESVGPTLALEGLVLMSGFYVNELLLRLLQRHDPHPELYVRYQWLLDSLGELRGADRHDVRLPRILRLFEKDLLQYIGYGLVLEYDSVSGAAVESQALYRYVQGQGPVHVSDVRDGATAKDLFHGSTLLALARESLDDSLSLREARHLLRVALDHCLGGRELHSRRMLMEMLRAAD